MRLSELARNIEYKLIGEDVEIASLRYNSKAVEKGDLFCCIVGTFADGHDYAPQAEQAGAAAFLTERRLDTALPQLIVPNSRIAMAEMAAEYYGHPTRGMRIVGVTGTNGKTSTTYMIKAIAEHYGMKVGLIGTIRNMVGERIIETERTTPESVDLQRVMRAMKDDGAKLVVMEVSSHSLVQKRVYGIEFDVAVFTNLTHDHLDYHKTFENYLAAKKLIFGQSKQAIVNADDPHFDSIVSGVKIPVTTYGIRASADFGASEIDITTRGVQFDMATPVGSTRVYVNTPGLFSVFNAMAAGSAALALALPLDAVKHGLESMQSVSGRLEPLPTYGRDYTVLLDYAHAPDALENILKTVRGFAKGRIVTLFGCGGDRDRAKRPIMGEIAGRFSDFLVVTSDNPRSEEPMKIIASIMEGVNKSGCPHIVIENRYDAIKYALENARRDDVIILAGKGHENYQETVEGKHHFDEKEIVADILKEQSGR